MKLGFSFCTAGHEAGETVLPKFLCVDERSGPASQNEEKRFYLHFAAVLEIKTTASSNFSSVLPRAKLNKSPALLSDESFTLPEHGRDGTTGS